MAVILIGTSACKKNNAQPDTKPPLYGDWKELNLNAGLERIVSFGSNDSFKLTVVNSTVPSIVISTYTGTYIVKNDNVEVKVNQEVVTKDKVVISTTAVNSSLFDKGTYKVENNVLTLKYITYPADAPVNTEATFKRFIE